MANAWNRSHTIVSDADVSTPKRLPPLKIIIPRDVMTDAISRSGAAKTAEYFYTLKSLPLSVATALQVPREAFSVMAGTYHEGTRVYLNVNFKSGFEQSEAKAHAMVDSGPVHFWVTIYGENISAKIVGPRESRGKARPDSMLVNESTFLLMKGAMGQQ